MKQSEVLSLIETTILEVLDEEKGADMDKVLSQALPKMQKLLDPAFKKMVSSKLKDTVAEQEIPPAGKVANKAGDVGKASARTAQVAAARIASLIPGGLGTELGALYAASKDMDVDPKVRFWITAALLNLVAGNFGIPGDISSYIMDVVTAPSDAIPFVGDMASAAIRAALSPLEGLDDAALILWAKRKVKKANLPAAKHYGEFEKWAGLPAGSATPAKLRKSAKADSGRSTEAPTFGMTRKRQEESVMKISELMNIIREEVEVVLTNEEASELFGEAWKGDPEVDPTGEYADKTKEELCAMKKKLMDKESRTEEEQTKVRQINFAIRSKQPGPKFGDVDC